MVASRAARIGIAIGARVRPLVSRSRVGAEKWAKAGAVVGAMALSAWAGAKVQTSAYENQLRVAVKSVEREMHALKFKPTVNDVKQFLSRSASKNMESMVVKKSASLLSQFQKNRGFQQMVFKKLRGSPPNKITSNRVMAYYLEQLSPKEFKRLFSPNEKKELKALTKRVSTEFKKWVGEQETKTMRAAEHNARTGANMAGVIDGISTLVLLFFRKQIIQEFVGKK